MRSTQRLIEQTIAQMNGEALPEGFNHALDLPDDFNQISFPALENKISHAKEYYDTLRELARKDLDESARYISAGKADDEAKEVIAAQKPHLEKIISATQAIHASLFQLKDAVSALQQI